MSENGQTSAWAGFTLGVMQLDPQHCYEALRARDARFDGAFFVAVSSTGIYCRPVCTARLPRRDHCSFYGNAASAEGAGYRPCLRCRPELAPGAAPVDAVPATARWVAMRIEAGALNDAGLENLAAEYGLSSRQLRRVIEQEYGVSPIELAQTRRLLLAKQLLTDTTLRMADVAFASGFNSVRRFNHLFGSRYGLNPTSVRRHGQVSASADAIVLKLAFRPPLAWTHLAGFLGSRGACAVEAVHGARYQRTVRNGRYCGWLTATPIRHQNLIRAEISPGLMPVLPQVLAQMRRLFDLDANPQVIESQLAQTATTRPSRSAFAGPARAGSDGYVRACGPRHSRPAGQREGGEHPVQPFCRGVRRDDHHAAAWLDPSLTQRGARSRRAAARAD